jgi:hypothetical protein
VGDGEDNNDDDDPVRYDDDGVEWRMEGGERKREEGKEKRKRGREAGNGSGYVCDDDGTPLTTGWYGMVWRARYCTLEACTLGLG